jgi:hypothetical protein
VPKLRRLTLIVVAAAVASRLWLRLLLHFPLHLRRRGHPGFEVLADVLIEKPRGI